MNSRDFKYFKIAKNISECSDFKQFHIGAVLVYKSDILSVGTNSIKTCPMQKKYNRFRNFEENKNVSHKRHAEINCLNKIPWYAYENNINFGKVKIYIWRSHKDGTKAMARPCLACRQALIDNGVKNIFYTTENGYCYERIG